MNIGTRPLYDIEQTQRERARIYTQHVARFILDGTPIPNKIS